MGAFVYCLYSTQDGVPRYVERANDNVSFRFRQHVTAALEKEPGPLYDWMRDVWRSGGDVSVHTLQHGISKEDVDSFEQYWIDQFPNLLNVINHKNPPRNTPIAQQVVDALRLQLRLNGVDTDGA